MFILLSSEAATQSVLKKKCSENMQQSYWRAPMAKCDFNKVVSNFIEIALQHGSSPVNLLHIFKKPFLGNSSGWLLLYRCGFCRCTLFTMMILFINKQVKAKQYFPADKYMFKISNRNTSARCEICSKLTIKTPVSLLPNLNVYHTLP